MLCCNVIHARAVQGDCAALAYQYVWEIRGVKTFEMGRSARSTKQSGAKVQLVHFYAITVTQQTKKDCPKVCCPQGCRLGALDSSVGNTHFISFSFPRRGHRNGDVLNTTGGGVVGGLGERERIQYPLDGECF